MNLAGQLKVGRHLNLIHPGSLLPMGCPINESNNMAVQRRNTDGRTDVQTDGHFSRLQISELGENSFILILLIVKVWNFHVKRKNLNKIIIIITEIFVGMTLVNFILKGGTFN